MRPPEIKVPQDGFASPSLERLQKRQQGVLIGRLELQEFLGDLCRFATVAADRVLDLERTAVVHEARAQPKSPKRGSPELVASAHGVAYELGMLFALSYSRLVALAALVFRLPSEFLHFCSGCLLLAPTFFEALAAEMLDQGNRNPVSSAYVVQKKIAVGVDGAVLEGVRMDAETSRTGRALARDDRVDVTDRAADLGEQVCAVSGFGSGSRGFIPRGSLQGADEGGKVVDVFQIVVVRVGQAVGFGNSGGIGIGELGRDRRVTDRCHFRFLQAAGDAHLVQISVGGEGEQARVLILPAKATDSVHAFALGHRNLHGLSADFAVRGVAL